MVRMSCRQHKVRIKVSLSSPTVGRGKTQKHLYFPKMFKQVNLVHCSVN